MTTPIIPEAHLMVLSAPGHLADAPSWPDRRHGWRVAVVAGAPTRKVP